MKILFLTRPIKPPWNEGSKNLVYEISKKLSKHEVHLLSCPGVESPARNVAMEPIFSLTGSSLAISFKEKMQLLSRLFKNDGVEDDYRLPLVIDYTSNGVNSPAGLREMTQTEFQAFFCPLIRQQIYNGTGNTLDYNINGPGSVKGSSITDTRLNGSGAWNKRFVGINDYRSQEFPNGTRTTVQTWNLKVQRT